MSAFRSLVLMLISYGLVFYILGLSISLIVGRGPAAIKYTRFVGKYIEKFLRWLARFLLELIAEIGKLITRISSWARTKL